MKKILQTTLVLGLLIGTGACTKLDLEPRSSLTPEVLFKDETAYRSFLAKLYAGLAVSGQQGPAGNADITGIDEGFSNYIRGYWNLQELTTDEAVVAWEDGTLQTLHTHTWTEGSEFVAATYYRIYYQISLANEYLRETSDDKLDARGVSEATHEAIHTYRAEARFLRALSYWHAIDLFGHVPFYTEETEVGAAPDQAPRAEVFSFIERELNDIENELPAPGENEYGRASKAALWMLQAHLYLNAEVYTGTARNNDVITATKKVIDSGVFSLSDNWRDLFRADNHLSPELIFAIPFDGKHTQTYGGTTFLVHASIGGTMKKEDYGVSGGWSGLRTTSALVDKFQIGLDERANFYTDGQSKDIQTITVFSNGYAVQKYTNIDSNGDPGSDLEFMDTDFPMFRLADAYLMYAEAVLRGGTGGDAATALGYVNALRERAYHGTTGNITANDLTLNFILDERARELYWEAFRRTDLIRFNQFTENGVWPWKGNVAAGQPTEKFRDLFPIPAKELAANPKLEQNDGY